MRKVLNYLKKDWWTSEGLPRGLGFSDDKFIQQAVIGLIGMRLVGQTKSNRLNTKIISLKKDTILAAVKKNSAVLDYASKEMKDDKEVVLAAVRNNGYALLYASLRLKGDKEVVLAAVRNHGWALDCAVGGLQNDKEVVLAAIRNNPHALDYASNRLINDIEIVNEAFKISSLSFYAASPSLKSNKAFIKEKIKSNNHEVFKYCHRTLRREKDIYLPVLKKDPSLCKLFSPNTLLKLDFSSLPKRNKEVILESFEKRTKEKDLFVLAKAKKHILG